MSDSVKLSRVSFPGLHRQAAHANLSKVAARSPVSVSALEQRAKAALEPITYDFIAGGAGTERTVQANLEAFHRYYIVPRMMRDISQRDVRVELFGQKLIGPVLVAPAGLQSIVHPEGELAVARAAAATGVPYILSSMSTHPIEEIAAAMGPARRWFQLYPSKDFEVTASFVQRAEASGYSAIVVTVDTRLGGWRVRDRDNGYFPFRSGEGLANYFSDPVFCSRLRFSPAIDPKSAVRKWLSMGADPSSTWADLRRLRNTTSLPILVKGILHPDDALEALDSGMDGIIVSNHGGRQVDGSIAALDALPAVVAALAGRAPILMDGGIRCGADILKALALGARAVLAGRPCCWALAVGGEQGVRDLLLDLLAEFDLTLGLSGYARCQDVDRSALRHIP